MNQVTIKTNVNAKFLKNIQVLLLSAKLEEKIKESKIGAIFDTFDRNRSGSIEVKEVKEALRAMYGEEGGTVSEKQLDDEAKVNKYLHHNCSSKINILNIMPLV